MKDITLEELLEAGCHFGHQVTRHNPKARDFIFEARDNIHIIDLAKTKEGLDEALRYIRELSAQNKNLVIVGTKRQAQDIIKEEVKRALQELQGKHEGAVGLYYVTSRWIGGMLTNFPEVTKNFKRLKDLAETLKNDREKARYTKKELGLFEKERQKQLGIYEGVMDLAQVPDALFIVDTHMENLAVREARATNVPTVGVVDTNADPFVIDYPIPANDDAVGSIKLLVSAVVDAWIDGKKNPTKQDSEQTGSKDSAEQVTEKPAKKARSTSSKKKEEAAKEPVKKVTKKKAAHSENSGQAKKEEKA